MITDILIFYYIFSILFMIGYTDSSDVPVWLKGILYLSLLVISPIMFPINIGYYIHENS